MQRWVQGNGLSAASGTVSDHDVHVLFVAMDGYGFTVGTNKATANKALFSHFNEHGAGAGTLFRITGEVVVELQQSCSDVAAVLQ